MIPKFRVWCKNNREWERDVCYIQQDGLIYQRAHNSERLIPVLPKNHIVMQSTGMTDKNGVEIYVGDIVIFTSKSINYADTFWHEYAEVFQQPNGAYRMRGKGIYETELYSSRKQVIVVGNIHQTSELLENERFCTETDKPE